MTKRELEYAMERGFRRKAAKLDKEYAKKKLVIKNKVKEENKEIAKYVSKKYGEKYSQIYCGNVLNDYNHLEIEKLDFEYSEGYKKIKIEREDKTLQFIIEGLKNKETIEKIKEYCEID